jgi:hypothetical protein
VRCRESPQPRGREGLGTSRPVREGGLIVVTDEYMGPARHFAQLGASERRLVPIHARRLAAHYREVVGRSGDSSA